MSLLLFAFYVDLQLWLVVILLSWRTLSLTHSIFGRDVELFADLLQNLTSIFFIAFLKFQSRAFLALLEDLVLQLLVPSIQFGLDLGFHILDVLVQLLYFCLDLNVCFWVEGGMLMRF